MESHNETHVADGCPTEEAFLARCSPGRIPSPDPAARLMYKSQNVPREFPHQPHSSPPLYKQTNPQRLKSWKSYSQGVLSEKQYTPRPYTSNHVLRIQSCPHIGAAISAWSSCDSDSPCPRLSGETCLSQKLNGLCDEGVAVPGLEG